MFHMKQRLFSKGDFLLGLMLRKGLELHWVGKIVWNKSAVPVDEYRYIN